MKQICAIFFLLLSVVSLWAILPEQEPVVLAVQQVLPAVVNIYTERMVEQEVRDPMDDFYEQFFGGGFSRGTKILRRPVRNLGSGILIKAEGYIVTNYHVVERAAESKIKVTLYDGKDYEATPIRLDEDQDLALIRIKRTEDFPYLDINQLSPNLLGQTVVAIGNPIGYESSVSQGILSAKNRTLTVGDISYEGLLQTDAAINPGNSGGPLVDINGKLVGLNSAKMGIAKNMPVENIGFAIPAERVKAFAEDAIAIARGEKPPPMEKSISSVLQQRFGLQVQDMTPSLASAFGYRNIDGLLISEVEKGSAAEEGGLEKGMLIVGIGPFRIHSVSDLPRQLMRIKTGEQVRFTLILVSKQGKYVVQRAVPVTLKAK